MKRALFALCAVLIMLLPGCSGGNSPIVTKAEYDQLQTDMSYSQVAAIIGDPGSQNQNQEFMGTVTTTYIWQNTDGSNLIVVFQNDKLVSKTQTLLP